MVFQIYSATVLALQVQHILVEVALSLQLPQFTLVGLASPLTQESRERVRAAIQNSDLPWPQRRITVNLVPSHLPKWGSQLELAMALGIILGGPTCEEVTKNLSGRIFALGELSLGGFLRGAGMGSFLRSDSSHTFNQVFNEVEIIVGPIEDIRILKNLYDSQVNGNGSCAQPHFLAAQTLPEAVAKIIEIGQTIKSVENRDQNTRISVQQRHYGKVQEDRKLETLNKVSGEPLAVLSALVALKGKYHLLLLGPHGSGKSMVAIGIEEARGYLSEIEVQERSMIEQAFGEAEAPAGTALKKPCIRLQSSMTREALEGALSRDGSAIPGELCRAHGGYAIMDEFLEFRRDVLETLRLPLEQGKVRLQRARFRTEIPARFQLIATTNLCPCGHLGSQRGACRCTRQSLQQYHRKLSGPVLDRFDMAVLMGSGQDLMAYLKSQGLSPAEADALNGIIEETLLQKEKILFSENRLSDIEKVQFHKTHFKSGERFFSDLPELSKRGQGKLLDLSALLWNLHGGENSEENFLSYLKLAKILRADVETIL